MENGTSVQLNHIVGDARKFITVHWAESEWEWVNDLKIELVGEKMKA